MTNNIQGRFVTYIMINFHLLLGLLWMFKLLFRNIFLIFRPLRTTSGSQVTCWTDWRTWGNLCSKLMFPIHGRTVIIVSQGGPEPQWLRGRRGGRQEGDGSAQRGQEEDTQDTCREHRRHGPEAPAKVNFILLENYVEHVDFWGGQKLIPFIQLALSPPLCEM